MKSRFFSVILLMVLLVTLTGNAQATPPARTIQPALVYVGLNTSDDLTRFASTGLAMVARLDGGLLALANQAGQQSLQEAGLSYQVLDPDPHPGTYYLATTRSTRPTPDYAAYGLVLLTTQNGVLLRMLPAQGEALSLAGAELRAITLTPKPIPSPQNEPGFPNLIDPDPIVQGMIDQITQTEVYTYDRQLAGEVPVWVDGAWYTIPSRYTYSGTPIQKATSFVGQHMADLGLDVEYHNWGGTTYPNVIGEITGSTNPENVYMIGAHIDDVQNVPGADDNASGSVATLLAADILSQYQWGCTLRFAFWTGEEEGLLGSYAYAQRAYQNGDNILGYLNLDMIAWNTVGSQPYITLAYDTSLPPSQQLAFLYTDVIAAYNINLVADYAPNMWGSDHNSFWDFGFTSILAIEDDIHGDFNPYYHTAQDTPAHTDPAYFTDFTKASLATFAHMSGCLIVQEEGALDGHVTAASGGVPLEGATVIAENEQGDSYSITTDASGYYTMTLPTDTYTVTASLEGYVPQSQTAEINPATVTTLDFALENACEPVSGLDFTWLPLDPFSGDLITFTASSSGTPPIDFQWDFGDTYTATGEIVTHAYMNAGAYPVILDAGNACGVSEISHDITVGSQTFEFFLPLLNRQ